MNVEEAKNIVQFLTIEEKRMLYDLLFDMRQKQEAAAQREQLVERALTMIAKLSDKQVEQVIRAASGEEITFFPPSNEKLKSQKQDNLQRLNALLNTSTDKEKAVNVALEVIQKYFQEKQKVDTVERRPKNNCKRCYTRIPPFMTHTKERRSHPMTNKLASIPTPISARIDELNELVEKHPQYIPVTAVAVYLGVNPEGLRRCIEAGQCPFGIAWSKSIGGNKAFKIPTLTFYLWVTQCCAFRYATVSPDFGIDRESLA